MGNGFCPAGLNPRKILFRFFSKKGSLSRRDGDPDSRGRLAGGGILPRPEAGASGAEHILFMRPSETPLHSALLCGARRAAFALAAGVLCLPALALEAPLPEASAASVVIDVPAAAASEAALAPEAAAPEEEKKESLEGWRENMTRYLSRAYRVSPERISRIIDGAIEAGRMTNLDPLLILSITAAESTFNPNAKNRSSGASGLMQVMPKVHAWRFRKKEGGVFDIDANLQVGAELLRELINKTGSLQRGLKHYVGAGLMSHDQGYGNKITREHSRLKLAAEGDVSGAVKLHRARRPAESFENKISGTFSEFKDWLSGESDR